MKIEIKHNNTGSVLFSLEVGSFELCLETAVKEGADLRGANLGGAYLEAANLEAANLGGANLGGAYLEAANLGGAYLEAANLVGANLRGAYLGGANLGGAYLEGAYLVGANLGGAYLGGAYLGGAYLVGAKMEGADLVGAKMDEKTVLPTGETWKQYLEEVVPALLQAGGKPLAEVATEQHWNCHSWENCPMAAAFNGHSLDDVPLLLRPRADQFVKLFDAGLIPQPKVETNA